MTNAELIQAIRAEIEYNRQRAEEEIPNDLEEAVDNYKNDYPNHTDAFAWASKRAFIAGAEWQEEKDNESAKLAEEKAFFAGVEWQEGQAPLPEDTVLFNKGVEEGKRLMMKEAVCYIAQADITATGNILIPFIRIGYTALSRYGIKVGDKVRIIIIKDDGKSD